MTTTQLKTARHYNLNLTALEALLILAERESLPMTILADEIGISCAALTGTADGLAKKQLIKRTHGTADRRSITLTLTELGRSRVYQLTGRELAVH
jgi:DNA-binding MarR family transcriptional regulator